MNRFSWVSRSFAFSTLFIFATLNALEARAQTREVEPNNSVSEATEVTLDTRDTFETNVGNVGEEPFPGRFDEDYWVFRDIKPGLLKLVIPISSSTYRDRIVGFEVFTEDGELIAGQQRYPEPLIVFREAIEVEAGTYFLRVYADTDVGYEIEASLIAISGQELEPNDEFANPLALQQDRYGRFETPFPETDYDIDYYAIRFSGRERLLLELTAFGDTNDFIFADFFSESGDLIFGGLVEEGNQTEWNFAAPDAGLYFLGVFGSSLENYSFRLVQDTRQRRIEIEPNDTVSTADPIWVSEGIRGQISRASTSTSADQDYYYFIVTERSDVRMSIRIAGERFRGQSLTTEILDSRGNRISREEHAQGESGGGDIRINRPGTYYIKVQGTSYEQYSISLSGFAVADVPQIAVITEIREEDGALVIDGTLQDDGGAPIQGYFVVCDDLVYQSDSLPIRATGLTNGREYSCFLIAYNDLGLSDQSNPRPGTPRGAPSQVQILSIESDPGALIVQVSADPSGGRILDYTVTCGSQSVTNTRSPIFVYDLEPDEIYTCTATARNEFGSGSTAKAATGKPLPLTTGLPIWLLIEAMKSSP